MCLLKKKKIALQEWNGDFFQTIDIFQESHLAIASSIANLMPTNFKFIKAVIRIERFTNTDLNGSQVLNKLKIKKTSYVSIYKESLIKDKLFKTMAKAPVNGNTIKLNSRRLFRHNDGGQNVASLVGTLIHERLHNVGFTHSSANDSKSVPYLLGELSKEIALMEYFRY